MILAPWKESHDKSRQHIKKQRDWFKDDGVEETCAHHILRKSPKSQLAIEQPLISGYWNPQGCLMAKDKGKASMRW